jgi:hypothetical protein
MRWVFRKGAMTMKRTIYLFTLVVLCLGLTLATAVAAQPLGRSRVEHLGVVWPGRSAVGRSSEPSALVALDGELLAEASDPLGDLEPPVAWVPWPDPRRGTSVGADSLSLSFPTAAVLGPDTAAMWAAESRSLDDGTLHDALDQLGGWFPGATSLVTDTVDLELVNYADLTQAKLEQLDSEHLRYEVTVRGNVAGAWDKEMYTLLLAPSSTQQLDRMVYLLPWTDTPQTWWSSIIYTPPVIPSPPLPYLDITDSRVSQESGEIILEVTVADTVPLDPQTAPVRPTFAWWFNQVADGGTSGGGSDDDLRVGLSAQVGFSWRGAAFRLVHGEWEYLADLQHDVSGNTVTVRLPAGLLPRKTSLLWSTSTGFFLGDDPDAYQSDVDWIDRVPVTLASYRVYLPIIHRGS